VGTAWWVVGVGLVVPFATLLAGGRGPSGSTGGPSAFAMDFVHLVAGSLWAGLVFMSAGLAARWPARATPADRRAMRAYVQSLSTLATIALSAVLAAGAFAIGRVLLPAPVEGIVGSRYGLWLGIKLALDDAPAAPEAALSAFRRVLVVESVVLALVLVAAALLATSAPLAGAA
jgi:putative copper resistance protein D